MRVVVTGASPDRRNRNTAMRGYVAEGFAELVGISSVEHVPLENAVATIDRFRPEIVLCFGSCMPDEVNYIPLRRSCDHTGAALAFWLHDDPYEFDFHFKVLDVADYIFSNDSWATLHYDHPRAFHLPMAASRSAHWRPASANRDIDVFFCGVAFRNRIALLSDLKRILSHYKTTVLGDQWPRRRLPFARNERLSNAALADHYSRALVTLNIGRDFHYANDRFQLSPATPGPRTFEAAMAGATQLYFVDSLEITDYYEPGSEVLLFDSVADFEGQLEALVHDRERAIAVGAAAQRRSERDHTYRRRVETLVATVTGTGSRGGDALSL